MGIPGPDRGKGGTHIVLPPDFEAKATAALTTVKIHRPGDESTLLSFVDTTQRAAVRGG